MVVMTMVWCYIVVVVATVGGSGGGSSSEGGCGCSGVDRAVTSVRWWWH